MGALTDQVASLRAFAILNPDGTAMMGALLDVLEDLAEAVDRLTDDQPRGVGSI